MLYKLCMEQKSQDFNIEEENGECEESRGLCYKDMGVNLYGV